MVIMPVVDITVITFHVATEFRRASALAATSLAVTTCAAALTATLPFPLLLPLTPISYVSRRAISTLAIVAILSA